MNKQTKTDRVLERAIDLITGRKDTENEFDLAIKYLDGASAKDPDENLCWLQRPLSCIDKKQSKK